MFVHKIDEEIKLKIPTIQDAEELFELTNQSRSYLREWLPWLDRTTNVEDTKSFLQIVLKGYSDNNSLTALILYKGKIVGTAGFNKIDWTNKIGSIGYWLGNEYQGHGIMTKVAKGLTTYAFEELKLNRVEIRAAEQNYKSRAIPERLGYTFEGQVRQAEWLYDHYVDHLVYGILIDEWKERNS